jgi:drug/metabolite transporter (DMT)-like permease
MAIALALASSALWGCSNFIGGMASRRSPAFMVVGIAQPAGLLVVGIVIAARGHAPVGGIQLLWAVLAAVAGGVGIVLFFRALAIGSMAIVATLSSLSPVVPLIVGLAKGERPSAAALVGLVLAIVGIVVMALEAPHRGLAAFNLTAGAGLALVAALLWGGSNVAIVSASRGGTPDGAAFVLRLAEFVFFGVAIAALGSRRPPIGPVWRPALVVGTLDTSALVLYTLASTKGLLSVVSVLSACYPVIVYFLARVFLKEELTRGQLLGAAITFAAVLLISVGAA